MTPTTLGEPVPAALLEPLVLRLAPEAVPCGFPSPSQNYFSGELDLGERLIRDRASTFIWQASGHSMTGAGIHDGDLLLVDRGVTPVRGHVVVAVVDGEYTVKRLDSVDGRAVLRADSPDHPDVLLDEHSELTVWGVVIWSIHSTAAPIPGGRPSGSSARRG
ncbi:MAG: translesion error-prone DNA polymerase V autoproteolytic subunit [Kocuria sp.]|nr:translesion error-prone DNA polymerase V autoproteolytic subunit [Kocuria sp.]